MDAAPAGLAEHVPTPQLWRQTAKVFGSSVFVQGVLHAGVTRGADQPTRHGADEDTERRTPDAGMSCAWVQLMLQQLAS